MENKVAKIVLVALPVGVLAAMGLMFLWCCPEWRSGAFGEHWHFKRQLCWNGIGIAAFCLPLLAGWARWLRFAPAMAAVWVVMFAGSQFSPQDGGGWFLSLGPTRLDVVAVLPFVLAMLFAWISHKRGISAVRMLLILGIGCLPMLTARVAADGNRVSRIVALFSGDSPAKELAGTDTLLARTWAQKTCVEALEDSHWFSRNGMHLKDNPPPFRFASAMPAAAALTFGKWFLIIAGTLASMEEVVGLDKIPHDKSETKDAIASGDTDGKMPK